MNRGLGRLILVDLPGKGDVVLVRHESSDLSEQDAAMMRVAFASALCRLCPFSNCGMVNPDSPEHRLRVPNVQDLADVRSALETNQANCMEYIVI